MTAPVPAPVNVHGTAIVIGTTGLLFTGPSGAGKSMAALHCMTEARARGLFSALVSDDQILVSVEGGRLIARAPVSIAGLAELRGAGIVSAGTIEAAVLHRAIRPIAPPFAERLAPEGETVEVLPGHALPLTRLPLAAGCTAFSLLAAIHPEITGTCSRKPLEKGKTAILGLPSDFSLT